MARIVIADESEEFRQLLIAQLSERYDVASCADGLRALELLRAERTDLVVLDLKLPGLDGLGLLKTIRSEGLAEAVVVTSLLFTDYVVELLTCYRVDYALQKPCSLRSLTERIDELCGDLPEEDTCTFHPADAVEGILLSLNMPMGRLGFRYCRELIQMLYLDPDMQFSKTAYPEVAKCHSTSPDSVEKAVRAAIAVAWENRNDGVWRRYFPMAPNGQIPKPTNSAFIARLAGEIGERAKRTARGR